MGVAKIGVCATKMQQEQVHNKGTIKTCAHAIKEQ
jgi:hypothetical protein